MIEILSTRTASVQGRFERFGEYKAQAPEGERQVGERARSRLGRDRREYRRRPHASRFASVAVF